MTRHEIRECMFCLLFQNEFYGTDEFAEQRDNFLEQKSITEKEKNDDYDEKS